MWLSDLSICFLILYSVEIRRISADWTFRIKGSYNDNENINEVKGKYGGPREVFNIPLSNPISTSPDDKTMDRNTPGFDFDDKEIAKLRLWPTGIIPYYIDTVSYDKGFRDQMRYFLENVNNLGSLQFIELHRAPPDDKSRWVMFLNRRGALNTDDYSPKSFTTEGVQVVVLGYDCFRNGDIFRVVLAIAGVPPQHNAPNRDEFIEIKRNNIMPDKLGLFDVLRNDEWLFHELEYDFQSAGHFDFHKHTLIGQATIMPKSDNITLFPKVGLVQKFSAIDILKMRYLYNYIANAKLLPVRKSDCKKMFKPGSRFRSFQSRKELLQPRKKPNKYLGLPDSAKPSEDIQPEENNYPDNPKVEDNEYNDEYQRGDDYQYGGAT